MRPLTNLESVALAHLARIQPCTAHQLRQAFSSSSSGKYSGSAGAIYPLVKRLTQNGMIKAQADANGAQRKTNYTITAQGRRAVKKWMSDLAPSAVFPDDPIRTRFQYITMLPAPEREKWFEAALTSIDQQDTATKSEYKADQYQGLVQQHVLQGALEMNQQRRAWLKQARTIMRKNA